MLVSSSAAAKLSTPISISIARTRSDARLFPSDQTSCFCNYVSRDEAASRDCPGVRPGAAFRVPAWRLRSLERASKRVFLRAPGLRPDGLRPPEPRDPRRGSITAQGKVNGDASSSPSVEARPGRGGREKHETSSRDLCRDRCAHPRNCTTGPRGGTHTRHGELQ